MKKNIKFVDLFAGCGGLSLGLEQSGFDPIFASDINESLFITYIKNRKLPESSIFLGDVNILVRDIDNYKKHLTGVDLVCGGPPCQGFSSANRQRIVDDPRNNLYKAYLDFLSILKPKIFLMENVKGMMNKIDEILDNFSTYLGNDYDIAFSILNAKHYGVPQNRERFFLIGNRLGISSERIFERIKAKKYREFVLNDALKGLPILKEKKQKNNNSLENLDIGFFERDFQYEETEFYKFINDGRIIKKIYNHKNRYNNPRDIEIYKRLPQGANSLHESISDIMPYKRRNGIFKDKYFKLDPQKVCRTITSHMKFDCNMYIHPFEPRGLSPREAARIQTFPDDYVFFGSQNTWYAQIGNAVPVKLAKAIGDELICLLK